MKTRWQLAHYVVPALVANVCAMQTGLAGAATTQESVVAKDAEQATQATPAGAELKPVVVTGGRIGTTDVNRTAGSVSVITDEDIEQNNAKDVKDALKYEPGVTVRRSVNRASGISTGTGRAGNEGVNIRGLEGNQVLLLEDGIPLPQSFEFGSGSAGRGDYLNTDLYGRIEVLRGPASVLYGSDGLTGAVNFVTHDPTDLLATHGKPSYFSLRSHYDSSNDSFGSTAVSAVRVGRVEAMVVASGTRGHETDNQGTNGSSGASRTEPDPMNFTNRSLLGKLVFHANTQDSFKLTAGMLNNMNRVNALSQVNGAYTWSGYTANSYDTTNKVTSNHIRLDYEHVDASNPFFQQLSSALFYRDAATLQSLGILGQNTSGATATRVRINDYSDSILGANVVAASRFDTGALIHQLTYGVDAAQSKFSTSSSFGTESAAYPEVFPKTTQTTLATYIQDDSRIGRWGIIPGLRFDAFELTPHADATYESISAGSKQATTKLSDQAITPRLALLYEVSPAVIPYVQYARGFRAPSAYQVNSYYGSNVGYYYQQVGNSNLKSETSDSGELGLRGHFVQGSSNVNYSLAAFSGRYKNFISMQTIGGSLTSASNPLIYQYINYSKASIRGFESKLSWTLNEVWQTKLGMALINGSTETDAGVRAGLDTVPPYTAVMGVKYQNSSVWFVGADMTYGARKKPSSMSTSSYYSTPSFTLVDLHAGYTLTRNISLTAGINNLFDRKYWIWNDVRGLAASSTAAIESATASGRSYNVGVKMDF